MECEVLKWLKNGEEGVSILVLLPAPTVSPQYLLFFVVVVCCCTPFSCFYLKKKSTQKIIGSVGL